LTGVCYTEPVIDPSSAAAALQKALSALGRHGSTFNPHTMQSHYADPTELRAASTLGHAGANGSDSFYEAYIIKPTGVDRSTIDSRACHGNHARRHLQTFGLISRIPRLHYGFFSLVFS